MTKTYLHVFPKKLMWLVLALALFASRGAHAGPAIARAEVNAEQARIWVWVDFQEAFLVSYKFWFDYNASVFPHAPVVHYDVTANGRLTNTPEPGLNGLSAFSTAYSSLYGTLTGNTTIFAVDFPFDVKPARDSALWLPTVYAVSLAVQRTHGFSATDMPYALVSAGADESRSSWAVVSPWTKTRGQNAGVRQQLSSSSSYWTVSHVMLFIVGPILGAAAVSGGVTVWILHRRGVQQKTKTRTERKGV